MIIKCPNCSSALEFDPESGKLFCNACCSYFEAGDLQTEDSDIFENHNDNFDAEEAFKKAINTDSFESFETNIYMCKSCGAEISVNGVEASTFCAYCGQPTIVFSRVSSTMKPEYIIPFKISKAKAISLLRDRFEQGSYVPKEFKEFEVERMRGIYIPYWLFDIRYEDCMLIKSKVGYSDNRGYITFCRRAYCDFNKLSFDASKQLNDNISLKIEPYNSDELVDFDIGYMSGYYSDIYDVSMNSFKFRALERAKKMFDKEVLDSCEGSAKKIIESNPKILFKDAHYAFLPAWFLTVRYKNRPYTFAVNGQTGKVIGAVPFKYKKIMITAGLIFAAMSVILSFLFSKYFYIQYSLNSFRFDGYMSRAILYFFVVIIAIILFLIFGIYNNLKKLDVATDLTREKELNSYVKERQDKN